MHRGGSQELEDTRLEDLDRRGPRLGADLVRGFAAKLRGLSMA